jgi:hypothetical protein
MCAINAKQCILQGKYNNSLTFIPQKTADETPQGKLVWCEMKKVEDLKNPENHFLYLPYKYPVLNTLSIE